MVVARNIIDPERLPAQGCQAEATPTIPSNAISSVILQGVDDDGKLRSLTFKRAPTMRNPRILLDPDYLATTGTAPPPRPPISLPPPGDLVLSLRLGAKLGRGGAGLVYEAFVIPNSSSPHLTSSPPVLPPLVVKISFRGKANKLAREAYYYDMCHPLQGASIPRYYGHFRTDVARNVSPVQSNDDGTVGDAISIARKRRSRPVYYDENESDEPLDDDSCGGSSESPEATPSPPPEIEPPDSDIEEIEQSVNSVSILVLERLGSYLPIGVPLSDALLQDVHDLFEDLAYMHVYPDDIRYENILSAPPCPPGFPGKVCTIHKRVHKWRLIDLEHGAETNLTVDLQNDWCKGWLIPILDNLPEGFYMNREHIF